jgi:methylenetetrahydrofolate dehydrogenase (NADP+)/methenyltetrahydrofolate cyclohydrolase
MIIDGKKIAEEILRELKIFPKTKKFLAVFSVAPDEATKKFLNQKKKIADELGVDFRLYEFEASIKQDTLRREVYTIASHTTCGGVVVQLPLPKTINAQYVLNVIPENKDVDVLGRRARELFERGKNKVLPPAVSVVERILKIQKLKIKNLNVAIVGLGNLIGKPVSIYFKDKCKELILLDKGDNFTMLKKANVIVCGAGDAGVINTEMIKENVLMIDFGYGTKDGKIMGDFDALNISESITYTPTPGGTGPILVAELFSNFFTLLNHQK